MYLVYSESYGFRSADEVEAHTCSSGTYSEIGSPPGTPAHQLRVSSEVMMYVRSTPRPRRPGSVSQVSLISVSASTASHPASSAAARKSEARSASAPLSRSQLSPRWVYWWSSRQTSRFGGSRSSPFHRETLVVKCSVRYRAASADGLAGTSLAGPSSSSRLQVSVTRYPV